MQINDYARGRTLRDRNHIGYVQSGCGRTVEETNMIPILDSIGMTAEIKYIGTNLVTGGVVSGHPHMSGNGSTAAAQVACHHQAVPPRLQDAQHALGCSDHSHNCLDYNCGCEHLLHLDTV